MQLINDPEHGGDAYRYVDAEQLKKAAPHLLQAVLSGYLTLLHPDENKNYDELKSQFKEALKAAGHPAGD